MENLSSEEAASIWNSLRYKLASERIPAWLQGLLARTYDSFFGSDSGTRIGFERKTLEADYLDWLRQQIHLRPRGQDWNRVLERRVRQLQST